MSMSKIDSTLMQGLEKILGLKGSQTTPQQIDLAVVQPTIDVGQAGMAGWSADNAWEQYSTEAGKRGDLLLLSSSGAVSGATGYQKPLIMRQGITWGSGGAVVPYRYISKNFRLLTGFMRLQMDILGRAAFATNAFLMGWLYIWDIGGGVTYGWINYNSFEVTALANNNYSATFRLPDSLLLPDGISLGAYIITQNGGNFPANTLWQQWVLAVERPRGAQLPL